MIKELLLAIAFIYCIFFIFYVISKIICKFTEIFGNEYIADAIQYCLYPFYNKEKRKMVEDIIKNINNFKCTETFSPNEWLNIHMKYMESIGLNREQASEIIKHFDIRAPHNYVYNMYEYDNYQIRLFSDNSFVVYIIKDEFERFDYIGTYQPYLYDKLKKAIDNADNIVKFDNGISVSRTDNQNEEESEKDKSL